MDDAQFDDFCLRHNLFLTQSEVDFLLQPGPPDPIRPGEHPREWCLRQGLPVDDFDGSEILDCDLHYDEEVLKFATPMTPGESLRGWAERVGYPPAKVDEIVAYWHDKM